MKRLNDVHNYENGYIGLVVPIPIGLPRIIRLEGYELVLKSEFHISLINAGKIAQLIDKNQQSKTESQIVEKFKDFVNKNHLKDYVFDNRFRLVQRDIRKSVIGMTRVPHLDEFFDGLRQHYGKDIPNQPTHITMYTLQPEKGIGILSKEELERDSKSVEIPELENFQFKTKKST